MLSYLYEVSLSSRHHLAAGVQGGYFNRRIDWDNKVITDRQYVDGGFNPSLPHGESFPQDQSMAFTTNVGLSYYLTGFDGEQLFHLGAGMINANKGRFTYLETDESQAEPVRWVVCSQLRLLSTASFDVQSHLYWTQENKLSDFRGGIQLRKGLNQRATVSAEHLGVGLYYSADHTATASLQLARPNWLVSLSYDMPFADKLSGKVQNAAEASIAWRLERKGKKSMYNRGRYIRKAPAYKGKKQLPWEVKGKNKKPAYKFKAKKKGPSYKARKAKAWKPKKNNSWKAKKPNKKLPWKKKKRWRSRR